MEKGVQKTLNVRSMSLTFRGTKRKCKNKKEKTKKRERCLRIRGEKGNGKKGRQGGYQGFGN